MSKKEIDGNYIYGKIYAMLKKRTRNTIGTELLLYKDLGLNDSEIRKILRGLEDKIQKHAPHLNYKLTSSPELKKDLTGGDLSLGTFIDYILIELYEDTTKAKTMLEDRAKLGKPLKKAPYELSNKKYVNLKRAKILLTEIIDTQQTITGLEQARTNGSVAIQRSHIAITTIKTENSAQTELDRKIKESTDVYIHTIIGMIEKEVESKIKEIKKLLS